MYVRVSECLSVSECVSECVSVCVCVCVCVCLTLVAVGPGEAPLTGAAVVAGREAEAAAVGAAHARRDVPHPLLTVVGRHGNRAAVNHWRRSQHPERDE